MPTTQVNGIDLYYEITGKGDPLLFIHGLGSSTRDWEEQVSYFARHYQVVVFDVRGHGQSAKPAGPYSIELFASDTAKLLQNLGITRTHVVGISMGGMIAFQLAARQPQMLKSLIIVNSQPEFIVRTCRERIRVWQRFLTVRLLGMRVLGKFLSRRLFPKPEHENLRRVFIRRWAENDSLAYRESMKAIIGWSVMEQIGDIDCPTLVIASDEDYTPLRTKQAYVKQLAHGKMVIINDARHAVPVERPAQFNAVLATFLGEHSA